MKDFLNVLTGIIFIAFGMVGMAIFIAACFVLRTIQIIFMGLELTFKALHQMMSITNEFLSKIILSILKRFAKIDQVNDIFENVVEHEESANDETLVS